MFGRSWLGVAGEIVQPVGVAVGVALAAGACAKLTWQRIARIGTQRRGSGFMRFHTPRPSYAPREITILRL
jgi:hypothetical protein